MDLTPKISVIIPVYNVEKYLNKCIDSVLNQTYKDFELILVDDGSPDKSGKICDDYAKKDKKIKVLHTENSGASKARNNGLSIAQGEFITFLDSDDYWEKDFLYNAISKIGNTDIYISGIKFFGGKDNREFISSFSGEITVKELYERVFYDIPQINLCGPCCKLFKLKIIKDKNITFDPLIRCGEDTDFNLSYARFARTAYIDNQSYYNYYRGNLESLFSSYNPHYYLDHVKVNDKWLKHIEDLNCSTATIENFKRTYVNALIGNLHMVFSMSRSKKEKKQIIRLLSKDKTIKSKIKVKGKNAIIKWLLKTKCLRLVYFIYSWHYCKK